MRAKRRGRLSDRVDIAPPGVVEVAAHYTYTGPRAMHKPGVCVDPEPAELLASMDDDPRPPDRAPWPRALRDPRGRLDGRRRLAHRRRQRRSDAGLAGTAQDGAPGGRRARDGPRPRPGPH